MIRYRRRQALMILVPSLLIGVLISQLLRLGETEARLVSIKSRLVVVPSWDFIYRREPRANSKEREPVKAAFDILMELESPELDVAELVRLTGDSDPDIRALALLGLVAQESREVIPACVRLVNDDAQMLPSPAAENSSYSFPPNPNPQLPTRTQMVGQVARQVLTHFDYQISYDRMAPPSDLKKVHTGKIERWCAAREDNPEWLGWYEFLYRRATQGTRPIPKSSGQRIARIRKQIDKLPEPTRNWLMLYLSNNLSRHAKSENYATEEEILDAARELGPDRLIAFLKDGRRDGLWNPKLDNPQSGRGFIIKNADELFTKEHASALADFSP